MNRSIFRAPCFYFAALAALLFGVQQAGVFAHGSAGARLVEAGMLALAQLAAFFPGYRALSAAQVAKAAAELPPAEQATLRKSLPPPPPGAYSGPGAGGPS